MTTYFNFYYYYYVGENIHQTIMKMQPLIMEIHKKAPHEIKGCVISGKKKERPLPGSLDTVVRACFHQKSQMSVSTKCFTPFVVGGIPIPVNIQSFLSNIFNHIFLTKGHWDMRESHPGMDVETSGEHKSDMPVPSSLLVL